MNVNITFLLYLSQGMSFASLVVFSSTYVFPGALVVTLILFFLAVNIFLLNVDAAQALST